MDVGGQMNSNIKISAFIISYFYGYLCGAWNHVMKCIYASNNHIKSTSTHAAVVFNKHRSPKVSAVLLTGFPKRGKFVGV